jgi:hypothetical protein
MRQLAGGVRRLLLDSSDVAYYSALEEFEHESLKSNCGSDSSGCACCSALEEFEGESSP